MNEIPFSSAARAPSWRENLTPLERVLRMWRVIVATLLFSPFFVASLLFFTAMTESHHFTHIARLFVLAICSGLLAIAVAIVLVNPRMLALPWRIALATLLVGPWGVASGLCVHALPTARSPALWTTELIAASLLAAIAVTGLRMVFWPAVSVPRQWRSFPPDPPPGSAPVLAPLIPPPPVLIMSAAKALPHPTDDSSAAAA
jgi:hypothetical protein